MFSLGPIKKGLSLLGCAYFATQGAAQACVTHTVASAVPQNTALAFKEYSYCGGTLKASAYIENIDYDKIVTLYYTNAKNVSTPLSVVQLNYDKSVADTNFEIWNTNTPEVNLDGIKQFLNITYQATDVGQTYTQQLHIAVEPSGPAPTTSTVPAPYATPTGFSQEITDWLAAEKGYQPVIAKNRMFNNIEVTDSAPGTIVAAQSYANPDYGYTWVRDSSLTMDVVATLYSGATNSTLENIYSSLFFRYAKARATQQNDPYLQTGLGEPKFNLNDSVYTLPWGRPQNDGAATAAISLMEFSKAFLAKGGQLQTIRNRIYDSNTNPDQAPVMKDLLFVASNWSSPTFDIWEEEEGDQFYTRFVQHRALLMGTDFAKQFDDSETANTLSSAASALAATLHQFWDPIRGLILYEYGPVLHGKYSYKDAAVILGINHGYAGDGILSYGNDKVLASALQIATSFIPRFPLSSDHTDSIGRVLGIPVGRYPEDTYNGVSTSSHGNPWYLCTSAMAELFYRASMEFKHAGQIKVTNTSHPFWKYFAPQAGVAPNATYMAGSTKFNAMVSSLQGWGDAFLRTVKYYTPRNGHMTEEFNYRTGHPQGAIDLTWSYAALLTAAFARAEATGQTNFAKDLANLYVTTNTTGPGAPS